VSAPPVDARAMRAFVHDCGRCRCERCACILAAADALDEARARLQAAEASLQAIDDTKNSYSATVTRYDLVQRVIDDYFARYPKEAT
jgi:hypothetical protein